MSIIMDYMFCTLIIVAILVIINSTFIAYLYYSYEYKKVDKYFLTWVTSSNYDIDNVVRGRIVSVSNKLMMKNLVVSELLSIFAVFFRAAFLRASHFRAGM